MKKATIAGSLFALLSLARPGAAQVPDPPREADDPRSSLIPPAPPPAAAPAPTPAPAAPAPAPTEAFAEPFAWGDFTWQNGQSRQRDFPLKAFGDAVTLSLYLDVNYAFSGNHPKDDTLTGTASIPRHNELAVNMAGFGLDWRYRNVIGRVSLQFGEMISLIQDQDGSVNRGRSLSAANLKYLREAAAGYHFTVDHGLNVEAGIFSSFVGLESYLLAENWTYSRALITENVPFYFQGVRVQYFPTDRFKIEPWLINGWQTYGKWNYAPAGGLATRWSPSEALSVFANVYLGFDTEGVSDRVRFHHDHAVTWRYYQSPKSPISKAALSLNNHVGFESGGAGLPGPGHANVLSSYLDHRTWFAEDHLAFTLRGEVFSNPSRYLAQYPPPGFQVGAGVKALQVWGITGTFDIMPNDFFTLRFEGQYRASSVPYFAGPGGTTSPSGFQPIPASFAPDAVKNQALGVVAINVRL